ncbi:hypothetical protein [Rhodoferax ferrireducens]|uniref:hypothetical protein n=1 Tax=Rhodoferax ferrireducens TaxID=192843 RepID=UPI0013007CC6|nr:hypothetical protein [Rhodoferax ferrireducens]
MSRGQAFHDNFLRSIGRSFLLLVATGVAACATPGVEEVARPQSPVVVLAVPGAASAEDKLGIQVTALRLSAGGFMLDLRYRILDPEKAALILDRRVVAYLLDSAGARLGVASSPKIGPLRSSKRGAIHLDRDYAMVFGNPGHYLQRGSQITLVIGKQKVENLIIE